MVIGVGKCDRGSRADIKRHEGRNTYRYGQERSEEGRREIRRGGTRTMAIYNMTRG